MARKNIKGTPFLNLGLDVKEEKKLKKHLADTDTKPKQLLRKLIREHLNNVE